MWKKLRILCLAAVLLFTGISWPVGQETPVREEAAETYMVYFDSQGGSQVNPVTNIYYGGYVGYLPTPTKDGYIFEGWYTDINYTTYFSAYTPVTDNMVVFAKWKEKEISYLEVSYESKTAVEETLLDKEKIIVKAHYYYDNSVKVLKPEEFEIDDLKVKYGSNLFTVKVGNVTGVFSVLGIKEPLYTVSFFSNGGSYVSPISGIKENQTISLPAEPYRDKYEFKGWYLDNNTFQKPFTSDYKVTKSIIVFAKWEILEVIEEVPVYDLNTEFMVLKVNEQKSLFVESYDPYLELEYASEDYDIATVNQNGIVEGKRPGETIIFVITPEGDMLECYVEVAGTKAKSIKLNASSKSLKRGKTFQIKASFSPSKVSSRKLKFTSSNSKVAKVSSSGKVTAKKKGTCYISVKTTDGSSIKKKVKIRVY